MMHDDDTTIVVIDDDADDHDAYQNSCDWLMGSSPFPDDPAFDSAVLFGRSTAWMLGSTPPLAMVTLPSSRASSSSFLIASWIWRGMMRVFLLSRAAFPASSRTCTERKREHNQEGEEEGENDELTTTSTMAKVLGLGFGDAESNGER
jgi:hypothetical protein